MHHHQHHHHHFHQHHQHHHHHHHQQPTNTKTRRRHVIKRLRQGRSPTPATPVPLPSEATPAAPAATTTRAAREAQAAIDSLALDRISDGMEPLASSTPVSSSARTFQNSPRGAYSWQPPLQHYTPSAAAGAGGAQMLVQSPEAIASEVANDIIRNYIRKANNLKYPANS